MLSVTRFSGLSTSAAAGAALLLSFAPSKAIAGTVSLCPTPLASQTFAYPSAIPYQVQTDQTILRGTQLGYNQCNSTTENQSSMCQTSFLNHIDDFCLWAPPEANSLIADTEGEEVAWCAKSGRGTRLIPNGALTGVQMLKTDAYVQIVGFIDQTQINMQADDYGGELDPHGADLCGNPIGSLVYSNFWSGSNDTYTQMIEWHNFMGGGQFCFTVCNPAGANAADYCQHIYDRIGCAYNDPNTAKDGVFEVCDSDNKDYPGIYTDASGAVQTYTQPAESLGAISTMPYEPKVPSSSNCVTYQSTDLYTALATVTGSGSGSAAASATATGSAASSAASASKAAASSSASKSAAAASSSQSAGNDASAVVVGGLATMFGVVGSMMFLA